MEDYLTIYFGSSTAGAKAVEYDNAMVVGNGDGVLAESKTYELSSDNWQSQLEADGFSSSDTLYNSVSTYFKAVPTPQRLFAFAYVSGEEVEHTEVPLKYVGGNTWEIPIKPPIGFGPGGTGIEQVEFYQDDTPQINTADGGTGIGFTVETGPDGNWTGQLTFDDGLSGINSVVNPLTTDSYITVDFTANNSTDLSTAVEENNIKLISLALENSETITQYSDNIFGSQLEDITTILNATSGKNVKFFYALPGNANPETLINGTSSKWKELKSLIGSNPHFCPVKLFPSSLGDDMASGYMAMTVISHPHQQMTFAEIYMGLAKAEPPVNAGKWARANIACAMQRTELQGDPYLITYGFTFGSGVNERIEGIRCRDILAETLYNNLWALLAKRDTLTSYDGVQKVKSQIRGTFKNLIDQKIVDGLVSIRASIEDDFLNNTDAGKLARSQRLIPGVEIEYLLYNSVEHIIITRAENVAV
jgi:hypothetical protein